MDEMSGMSQDFDATKFKVCAICKGPFFGSIVTSDFNFLFIDNRIVPLRHETSLALF